MKSTVINPHSLISHVFIRQGLAWDVAAGRVEAILAGLSYDDDKSLVIELVESVRDYTELDNLLSTLEIVVRRRQQEQSCVSILPEQ